MWQYSINSTYSDKIRTKEIFDSTNKTEHRNTPEPKTNAI